MLWQIVSRGRYGGPRGTDPSSRGEPSVPPLPQLVASPSLPQLVASPSPPQLLATMTSTAFCCERRLLGLVMKALSAVILLKVSVVTAYFSWREEASRKDGKRKSEEVRSRNTDSHKSRLHGPSVPPCKGGTVEEKKEDFPQRGKHGRLICKWTLRMKAIRGEGPLPITTHFRSLAISDHCPLPSGRLVGAEQVVATMNTNFCQVPFPSLPSLTVQQQQDLPVQQQQQQQDLTVQQQQQDLTVQQQQQDLTVQQQRQQQDLTVQQQQDQTVQQQQDQTVQQEQDQPVQQEQDQTVQHEQD
ncbi:hypothetical protein FHG87_019485 [Trinorchestia longiramus]|nr:hypothetical protein FHG87_019485 [Trinorchestia longiramus]